MQLTPHTSPSRAAEVSPSDASASLNFSAKIEDAKERFAPLAPYTPHVPAIDLSQLDDIAASAAETQQIVAQQNFNVNRLTSSHASLQKRLERLATIVEQRLPASEPAKQPRKMQKRTAEPVYDDSPDPDEANRLRKALRGALQRYHCSTQQKRAALFHMLDEYPNTNHY